MFAVRGERVRVSQQSQTCGPRNAEYLDIRPDGRRRRPIAETGAGGPDLQGGSQLERYYHRHFSNGSGM